MIAKKTQTVQQLKMIPLVCIGETLIERESGKTFSVLEKQLIEALALGDPAIQLHIAYEPVWAIGTGKVASTAQVQETHGFVRQCLDKLGYKKSQILYGGSVKSENAKQLLSLPNVDGFLVGGASLEPRSFLDIINA
jgi:triosephosphate isomerase